MNSKTNWNEDKPGLLNENYVKEVVNQLTKADAALAGAQTENETTDQQVSDLTNQLRMLMDERGSLKKDEGPNPPDFESDEARRYRIARLDTDIENCERDLAGARKMAKTHADDECAARAAYREAVTAVEERVELLLVAELPGRRSAIKEFAEAVGEPELGKKHIDEMRGRLTDKNKRDDKSADLESKIGELLAHISSKRVSEEQDSANYNHRTRKAFERTAELAKRLADGRIEELIKTVDNLHEKIGLTADKRNELLGKIDAAMRPGPDNVLAARIESWKDQNDKDRRTNQEAAKEKIKELRLRQQNLLRFSEHVLGEANVEIVIAQASIVAHELESGKFLRYWPIFVAGLTGLLFLFAISADDTVFLPSQRGIVIGGVVFVGFLFSLRFGVTRRRGLMHQVRTALQGLIERVLNDRKFSAKDRFRFRSVLPSNIAKSLALKPLKRKLARIFQTCLMYAKNSAVIVAPAAALLAVSQIAMDRALPDQIGKFLVPASSHEKGVIWPKLGTDCVHLTGRLVRETDSSLFLKPMTRKITWGDLISPAVGATMIERADGMRVVPASEAGGMPDCAEMKPFDMADTYAGVLASAAAELGEVIKATGPGAISSTVVRVEPAVVKVDRPMQGTAPVSWVDLLIQKAEIGTGLPLQIASWAVLLRELLPTNVRIVVEPASSETVFFTSVVNFNDGTRAEHRNAMVLPFFPIKIEGTGNDTDGAFRIGRDKSYKTTFISAKGANGTGEAEHRDYFDVIVEAIRDRLDKGEAIAIDVMGFASIPWKTADNDDHRNELNHALAEGRRAAVLNVLSELLGEDRKPDRIWLIGRQGETCFNTWSKPETLTDENKRFRDYGAMVAEMKRWIATSEIHLTDKEVTDTTLGHFLKRSVVLRLEERDGDCGKPPKSQETEPEDAFTASVHGRNINMKTKE